jgi:choline dehydrogenase-like flavoprotein
MAEQFTRAGKVKEGLLHSMIHEYVGQDAVIGLVALVRPQSSGELRLKSKLYSDPMIIDPKYLGEERDVKVLVEGAKLMADVLEKSTSFRELNSRMISAPVTGCEGVEEGRSDAFWECTVRTLLTTVW